MNTLVQELSLFYTAELPLCFSLFWVFFFFCNCVRIISLFQIGSQAEENCVSQPGQNNFQSFGQMRGESWIEIFIKVLL